MVARKVKIGDEERLTAHFQKNGWLLFGPDWLRDRLHRLSDRGYCNQVAAVVAKILLREGQVEAPPATTALTGARRRSFQDGQLIPVLAQTNPKRPGSKARERFQKYFESKEFTVGEARGLGLETADFRNDVTQGYISIA